MDTRAKVLPRFLVILALIVASPGPADAGCATSGPIAMCSTAGMSILGTTTNSHFIDPTQGVGGSFWLAGAGDPAVGAGSDSGTFGRPVVDPTTFSADDWLSDFLVGDGSAPDRCFIFDAGNPYDGCLGAHDQPLRPSDVVVAVVTDTNNNYVVFSSTGLGGVLDWDFILLNGGGIGTQYPMVPSGFGSLGMALQRAVDVASVTFSGSTATVTVRPLAYNYYDETGSNARYPDAEALHADLYGFQAGAWGPLGTGAAAGTVSVDAGRPLCWGFSTGEFTPEHLSVAGGHLGVACVDIEDSSPGQQVDRAVAFRGRGEIRFEWHVTSQLDIAGFDIVSIDPTKGTERTLNATLIFQGMNDGTDESYAIGIPRRVVKRPGVYELRMVRQDGFTTSTRFIEQ